MLHSMRGVRVRDYENWPVIQQKGNRESVEKNTYLGGSEVHSSPTIINLYEPCVLYIGRAYRYPPDVAFYIFFFSTNIST